MSAKIGGGATYEEVHEKWPSITRVQFDVFKNNILDPNTIASRAWGKELQSKNIGPHHLGSNGYQGKELDTCKTHVRWETPRGRYDECSS